MWWRRHGSSGGGGGGGDDGWGYWVNSGQYCNEIRFRKDPAPAGAAGQVFIHPKPQHKKCCCALLKNPREEKTHTSTTTAVSIPQHSFVKYVWRTLRGMMHTSFPYGQFIHAFHVDTYIHTYIPPNLPAISPTSPIPYVNHTMPYPLQKNIWLLCKITKNVTFVFSCTRIHLCVAVAEPPELPLHRLEVLGDVSQRSSQGWQTQAHGISPLLDVFASL